MADYETVKMSVLGRFFPDKSAEAPEHLGDLVYFYTTRDDKTVTREGKISMTMLEEFMQIATKIYKFPREAIPFLAQIVTMLVPSIIFYYL